MLLSLLPVLGLVSLAALLRAAVGLALGLLRLLVLGVVLLGLLVLALLLGLFALGGLLVTLSHGAAALMRRDGVHQSGLAHA